MIPDTLLRDIHSGIDTVVIKAVINLSSSRFSELPATSRRIAIMALMLSEKADWYKGRQRALQYIGLSWQKEYENDSAEFYYLMAAKEAIGEKDYQNAGRCYGSVGLLALNTAKYDKSEEYFNLAYSSFLKCNDSLGMGMCMLNGSQNFSSRGNVAMSLRYNYKALSIGLALKNDILINGALNNIGVALLDNEDWESAQKAMLLVYKMGIRSGDKKAQAHAMNNLGIITQNMGDTTASLNYYKSFLALASDMKDKKEISLAYNNLGSLYYEQNDLTKAEDYFTKAFLLVKEIDNLSSMSHYTRNLSDVYLKKSDIQKGIDYAFTAYQWADSCESLKEKVQALKNLSDGYERLNNSHQSLLYLKDYLTYNDSLKNSENTSSLQDLKIKFETEQKEQTIKLLEKEMEIKESRLIFIIIFAILVVFVFIIIIRLKNLKVKASQSEKALAEAHLKNAQFETDSLKKELEFKNKELSLAAINLVQKHEFIESISLQLQDSVKQNNDDQKTKIQKQLSFSQNLEKERKEFQHMVDLHRNHFS